MSANVSIIITCYNYAQYLEQALESCVNQTWENLEIVIVNDGSQDATGSIAKMLIEKYTERNFVYCYQENQGLPAARNTGIRKSSGDYILPLDADDAFEPQMVEKCIEQFEKDSDLGIAYCLCRYFGDENKIANWIKPYNFFELCRKDILGYASMFKKEMWERIGGYNLSMRQGYEDWEFWIRAGRKKAYGRLIAQPLFLHRIHGPSMYCKAAKLDCLLKAKIVMANRQCYTQKTIRMANRILADNGCSFGDNEFILEPDVGGAKKAGRDSIGYQKNRGIQE